MRPGSVRGGVDGVSLQVEQGEFIAILGHNGSGKSTLAKHINALLCPTEGSIWVDGMDTKEEKNVWNIRQTAGMVFQNPDNQNHRARWWKRTWASARKIWAFPQKKSGSGWRRKA